MYTPIPLRHLSLALAALVAACDRDPAGLVLQQQSTALAEWGPRPSKDEFTWTPADPPFYARVERPYIAPHDDTNAAIVFYRSPECVPSDFNLLDLFDVPGAFGCEMTTRGREYRAIGSDPFAAPYLSVLQSAGRVPIWFVSTAELMGAAADDILTIRELRALPSLVRGWAAPWTEWLEPFPTRIPSRTVMSARGVMPGVGHFRLDYEEVDFAVVRFDLQMLP